MKKLLICAAAISLLSCSDEKKDSPSTSAVDSSKVTTAMTTTDTAQAPPMDSAAMTKAWQAYMTPADQHRRMAIANGKWAEETSMYMSPGAAPEIMKGSCENTMIMNGLYQSSVHHASYNGMPFEGRSTMGYNTAAKKYESTWIDNMGSGMMKMEGDYDDAAKTYNMKGTETDMMTGKEIPVRETFKLVDDKNQYMEMFETRGGKESKVMEVKYTKQ